MKSAIRPLLIILALSAISCWGDDKKADDPTPQPPDCTNCEFSTGWNSGENYSQTIPVAINYGNYQSGSSLPASVDLTGKFPPIGNQGMLGTCVAWAVGYNTKSYLDGIARNLSQSQLQNNSYQYSPTDLFFAIEPSRRACNTGTFFDDAFNVLINRGVNTLLSVPYDQVCHQSSPGNPSSAAANKIKNFRRIQGSVTEIKEYLAQGVPVVLGAMVNGEFQRWKGSAVLNNLNYGADASGHAMVIAGYDDARNAFRIINSWGTGWGDYGYAWVGYDFLVNKFCVQGGQRSLFVAFNDNTTTVDPQTPTNGGPDLTSMVMSDYTLYPTQNFYSNARRTFFDVKNVGSQAIQAASNWNIYYLWMDAFNANNYGIIFRGEFTTSIPQNTYQNINANYARINYDLSPGASLGQTIFGLPYISWDYYMPTLSGNYYLVMYIDKGGSNEANQTNNVFYVTQAPKFFSNGYSQRRDESKNLAGKYHFEELSSFKHSLGDSSQVKESQLTLYRSLSNTGFPNAYKAQEIASFLSYKIKHGGL
ncbi:C1 family peptidase [Chitinophaga rhizophila]|uniref:C39 family peptidase n=1 Tax=Chitinophaga rhizophila TaxID=2866212 RepID=A0ABS7G8Q9_9BACT|nr:C1 family peptidase [Chitinophaga rhizophila]MBW8683087.1 C39 family peptidase [Chitinophaga rhizophila]